MSEASIIFTCPICNSHVVRSNAKGRTVCTCGANERSRIVMLAIERFCALGRGKRIAHFAPEKSLGRLLRERCGDSYQAYDFDPARYSTKCGFHVNKIDLCGDSLESGVHDIVIHNHVIEHLPCNYTIVLQRLHNALRKGGVHLFTIPVLPGAFAENLSTEMGVEDRRHAFGHHDHVRKFGSSDLRHTIGMIFDVEFHSLLELFGEQRLQEIAIERSRWGEFNGWTPIILTKA